MLHGIYRVSGTDDHVVGAELGGMFMTSELLNAEDVEDLITGAISLLDCVLTDERNRAVVEFELIPYEKWVEIEGSEIDSTKGRA